MFGPCFGHSFMVSHPAFLRDDPHVSDQKVGDRAEAWRAVGAPYSEKTVVCGLVSEVGMISRCASKSWLGSEGLTGLATFSRCSRVNELMRLAQL